MGLLKRKLRTTRRVLDTDGARGVLAVAKRKLSSSIKCFESRRWKHRFDVWCQTEHPWLGRIVEWRGNKVSLDSCVFSVSSPIISTATKSLFLQDGYERCERDILKLYLNRSRAVVELGGAVGVVACVTNKMLDLPGRHVVVEANPDLIGILREHREQNGCRFTVLNRALAYGSDEVAFYQDAVDYLGSSVQVQTAKAVPVPTITLARILDEYGFDRCTLICDIEGGEMDLVKNEADVLRRHVEQLVVEIHGWRVGHDQAEQMIRTLEQIGFERLCEKGATSVFRNVGLPADAARPVFGAASSNSIDTARPATPGTGPASSMTESSGLETPHVSIVVSTYNRCEQLCHALAALLKQSTGDLICEIIVVDNNSTDATRSVIESFIQSGVANLQYVFEPRQGLSHGRNTGIARARAPVIAFTDDDVCTASDWALRIKRCFDQHPEADFIGGKVLPRWRCEPPAWLTPDHWSPLALVDYGDTPFIVDRMKPFCLVGANLAFRREVFDRLGTFSPDLQRVRDGIGSAEDYEMHLRVWNAGGKGLYAPEIVVTSDVEPDRVTKAYHRKWYAGHGRFSARMRLKEVMSPEGCLIPERTLATRLFGVPSFVFVELFCSLGRWAEAALRRQESSAFYHENRTRHCIYYIRQRYRQNAQERNHSTLSEIARFIRTVVRKKLKAHPVKSQAA